MLGIYGSIYIYIYISGGDGLTGVLVGIAVGVLVGVLVGTIVLKEPHRTKHSTHSKFTTRSEFTVAL